MSLRCQRVRSRSSRPRRPRTSGSPTSPPTPASASCTNPPPPRTNTSSRPWGAAWRSSTTTTMDASTCSSRTARSIDDPMPEGKRPDKSDAKYWNRLYRQTAGRDVHRRHREGRVDRDAAELLRHGRRGRRLRQRRLRGSVRHQLRRQHALSQQRRRHVHRRHRPRRRRRAAGGARARASSTPTTTASSICSSRATSTGRSRRTAIAARRSPAIARTATPTTTRAWRTSSTTTTATARSRTSPRRPASPTPNGKGLGVAFADYDSDGCMDIYVANDSVQRSSTTTTATARSPRSGLVAGVGFNEDGKAFAGMGVDFADYDNDGRPDIIVTDLSNERYKLFHQNARRQLPRRDEHVRSRRAHAAVFRLGHAVPGLRQ